ncbi:ribosome maturation factor RimP [Furfurilactobacillus milii]|uniref:Ribosome maturation factor RimP n=1 Tax=Furfurilactobacillus rossiae TaxID=231049 RepID=A0A7C9IRE5_9LACO|nr:ribosome maturation factor RimP [Furfurilactobacillus milii]MYV04936.1 ribosome maturation factor RimP [Furfurilactobacillus milii]
MSSVTETVTQMVQPIVDEHHFQLVDVEFVKEGKSWYLRVYVDKQGGITIDDCVIVNDALSAELDAADPDPIPQAYYLEVSSPGAERPLKKEADFESAVNQYIHISLYQPINKVKVFEGTLAKLTPETLTLNHKVKGVAKTVTIERKAIASARLAIDFSGI